MRLIMYCLSVYSCLIVVGVVYGLSPQTQFEIERIRNQFEELLRKITKGFADVQVCVSFGSPKHRKSPLGIRPHIFWGEPQGHHLKGGIDMHN